MDTHHDHYIDGTWTTSSGDRWADRARGGAGAYVEPTIFSDATRDMTIHQEEIFGPVLPSSRTTPRRTPFGWPTTASTVSQAASGPTREKRAQAFARKIRAGQVQVNDAAFNVDAPFGGSKQSGNGREAGEFGLEVKAIQQ